ncbi:hypothetical protein K470DRAFT_90199 [Piedraia hortae CBS 480.64]|uniref:Uncharacterized protein n=1 Tax=Piedraia hortae CBS 480.64 TaxID=1314780 RepID=A0A6A7BX48_9PEZI|nr:hypothetical protein K470DRAFT_90199 [Piedraia hortae CBS 480.64]
MLPKFFSLSTKEEGRAGHRVAGCTLPMPPRTRPRRWRHCVAIPLIVRAASIYLSEFPSVSLPAIVIGVPLRSTGLRIRLYLVVRHQALEIPFFGARRLRLQIECESVTATAGVRVRVSPVGQTPYSSAFLDASGSLIIWIARSISIRSDVGRQ